jgi:hypothetical protein
MASIASSVGLRAANQQGNDPPPLPLGGEG